MDRLLELLTELSFARKRVVLTSGRESDFFIDCKQTVLRAEGHALVGAAMLERLETAFDVRPVAVAGVALGGCSLASAVALTSQLRASPEAPALDALYVRKSAKAHGSKRLIEGNDHLPKGAAVVVLEDVVTTGGSTLDAVAQLRDHGLNPIGVVAIVDRCEGAAERISAELPFTALFERGDFMDD